MGFKDLCPNVLQNIVQDTKYPRFNHVIQGTFFTMPTNILISPRWEKTSIAVGQTLTGSSKTGRERCVDYWLQSLDWDCWGWGTDM
jgi:hypothetical protein